MLLSPSTFFYVVCDMWCVIGTEIKHTTPQLALKNLGNKNFSFTFILFSSSAGRSTATPNSHAHGKKFDYMGRSRRFLGLIGVA